MRIRSWMKSRLTRKFCWQCLNVERWWFPPVLVKRGDRKCDFGIEPSDPIRQRGRLTPLVFPADKTSPRLRWSVTGWQRLCGGTKGLRRKIKTRTEIFSPNIRYFVAILRLVAIHAVFGRLWAKTVFLGQEVHYEMVYIAYHTDINLQITRKKRPKTPK